MHIIDSHFHWWPRSIFEKLCKRKAIRARASIRPAATIISAAPTAVRISIAGPSGSISTSSSSTWTASATTSTWSARSVRSRSPSPTCRSRKGRDYATMWNEEMAGAQKKYPGRAVGQRGGAAAGHQSRHRGARPRHQQARPDGRQPAGQCRRRPAHRCRAARAVLRARRTARRAAVPASDRRRLPGHARRLWRRAAPEPRPRDRGQRRRLRA